MNRIIRAMRFAPVCLAMLGATVVHGAEDTYLRISCEGSDVGAEITVNGVFKGECPLDLQVKPGGVKISALKKVDADHERIFEQELKMGAGTAKRIEVVLSAPRLSAAATAAQSARIAAAAAAAARQEAQRQSAAAAREQDAAAKLRQLQLAAEAGDATSMVQLARRYEDGVGVPQERALALAWYRRAAKAGNQLAQASIGAFAVNGWIGGKRDFVLAREICEPAATAGNARCMLVLATLYALGEAGLPRNQVLSAEWGGRAARAGLPRAMHRQAVLLMSNKENPAEVLRLATRATEPEADGHPGAIEAYATLCHFYTIDAPGYPKDEGKALAWCLKGVDAGSREAMNQLGNLYGNGSAAVPKDVAQAVAWWRKAAEAGEPGAMGNLGMAYLEGSHGLPVDRALATDWYQRALAAGDERARPYLRMLGQSGR